MTSQQHYGRDRRGNSNRGSDFRAGPWLSICLVWAAWCSSWNLLHASDAAVSLEHREPRLQVVTAEAIKALQPRLPDAYPSVPGPMIACRAAGRWMPSQLLRQRAKTIEEVYCDQNQCSRDAARAIATFLRYQACAQEDSGASAALKAYYSRVAIKEQLHLAQQGTNLLDQHSESIETLFKQGLGSIDKDPSELLRRKIELEDQRIVARRTDAQLRSALCQLADVDFDLEHTQIESLDVHQQSITCEGLCQIAVQQRLDLRAWECLCNGINDCSAEMFAQTLTPMVGGVTLSLPNLCFLDKLMMRRNSCLTVNVRKEISLAHQQLKRRIERSVHEDCLALQAAYQRIELADQIVHSLERRIDQLAALDAKGESAAIHLFDARGKLAISRSTAVQRRLEARLAEIDVAEEVGGLACRCCENVPWLLTGVETSP